MTTSKQNVQYVDPNILTPHSDRHKAGTILSNDDGRYLYILQSIENDGIEEAIKVQSGKDVIIGGHTRQRIALELGLKEVPVVYYDVDDESARYMMVTDNHKRIGDEHDPMKLAWTFKIVMDREGHSWGGDRTAKSTGWTLKDADTIASAFGLKRASLFRYIELLKLIPKLQHFVSEQKIGVKAGAQLAKLHEHDQKKVFQSIMPEALGPDYRLTETEAKSFVDAFMTDEQGLVSENGTDETEDKLPFFRDQSNYAVTDLGKGGYQISGRGVDEAQEQLQAREWMEQPERKKYLSQAARTESEGDSRPAQALDLEQSTIDTARKLLRIEDEDARHRYATRRLQASLYKFATWAERMESELIPFRSVVGDELEDGLSELWEQLNRRLQHVSDLMKQFSGGDGR